MASHLLAAAIRIHHLNPVTAPPLRFVESPWQWDEGACNSTFFAWWNGGLIRIAFGA
jgi:hypothetical protein